MSSVKTKLTMADYDTLIAYSCPYCEKSGKLTFAEFSPSGFDTIRCENKNCGKLFVIEWSSTIETRSGKVDFPDSPGHLFDSKDKN